MHIASDSVSLFQVVSPGTSTTLKVLKFAENDFSFHWTKEGSRGQIKTTSKPNELMFQSVSEEDFGYYRCEVKEAEKVVLTVYRVLLKSELYKIFNVAVNLQLLLFL